MSERREYKVGEVAEIYDGPHATPRKASVGPLFLSISSLQRGRLDLQESSHISEEDFRKWTRRVTPRAGDVLFSYETRLGEAALMPNGVRGCLGRRMGLLRPRAKIVDPRYLLFAYLGPEFQQTIQRNAVRGATVDRIPLVDLPSWPISLPGLPEQREIVSLLGALDDKIAINERMAATALKLASTHLEAAATDSARWPIVSLTEAGRWYSGGTPQTRERAYWGGDIPWISAASLHSPWVDSSDRNVTDLGVKSGTRLIPAGSVIFVVRGMSLKSEFRVGITQREVAFGQDCKAIVAADGIDPYFLFLSLWNRRDQILDLVDEAGHGTGRLQTDRLAKLMIPVPSAEEQQRIMALLRPLADTGAKRQAENRVLAELRDTLLPGLISGELRIKDAERVVEDAV